MRSIILTNQKNLGNSRGFLLIFFSHAHKIFFKASITARLRLESFHFTISFLYGCHQIIHILPNEYLEKQIPSFFQIHISHIYNREVEFHAPILVNPWHAGRRWSDIRGHHIKTFHAHATNFFEKTLCFKYVMLKEMQFWISKRFDFLDIHPHNNP